MKLMIPVLSVLFALPSQLAFALEGGVHGGGGNGLHSTPEQVAIYLRKNLSWLALDALTYTQGGLGANAVLPIQDPRARPILADILNLKNVVKCGDVQGSINCNLLPQVESVLEVRPQGACIDGGQERDASVSFYLDANGQPMLDHICFSAERLAQYPDSAFEEQLSALFLHELAHVAGYEEADAIYVQNYAVSKIMARDCGVYVTAKVSDDQGEYQVSFGLVLAGGYEPIVKTIRQYNFGDDGAMTLELNNTGSKMPAPVEFRFSPDGGHIQFVSLDTNGQRRVNQVDWTGGLDGAGFNKNITRSILTFNGRLARAVDLQVSAPDSCSR